MTEINELVNTNQIEEEQGILPLGVTLKNKQIVVSSKDIARVFGKRHDNVLRDIQDLECSPEFHALNFEGMMKTVAIGKGAERESPVFQMTKNGFVFLVMGYTGKLAARFKEAYIAEFDRMEAELNKPFDPAEMERQLRAFARDEAQKQFKATEGFSFPSIPIDISIDPEADAKNKKRLRVLHAAEQVPSHVKLGDWYEKIAEAEDISVPTLYRWISEARNGKVARGKVKPYFSIHVTLGEAEFDIHTRAFCAEAVKWFAEQWAGNPGLNVKEVYLQMTDLAEERHWKIGSLQSLYRKRDQIAAAIEAIENGAEVSE